jgi:hypothetical protein
MIKSSYGFSKCERNSGCRCLSNGLSENLGVLLYAYLHPLLGADEVCGESWQLVTTIYDQGDGLTVCEEHL